MPGRVILIGTLDTKGQEFKYVKDIIERVGLRTLVIDTGVKGEPYFTPDISAADVAQKSGISLNELRNKDDRGLAIDVMARGSYKTVKEIYEKDDIAGIISLGGSAGTTIGSHAMQALPVGIPKLMVSTVASGDTRPYVQTKDINMMYSVVDIAGINSISRKILGNAANAIIGMVKGDIPETDTEKLVIAATMFGVTTPCVTMAKNLLEDAGYEVLVFHATGSGGKSMEDLIKSGFISGVLDVTLTELCDELVGGVMSAGRDRLTAAGEKGLPQVVSCGALDMVNFGAPDAIPDKFRNRKFYRHNPTVTLMRTNKEECKQLGEIIANKLNKAKGPTTLFIPLKGVSAYDVEDKPFYGPEEDAVLFKTLKNEIDKNKVEIVEMNTDINDPAFARAMVDKMLSFVSTK